MDAGEQLAGGGKEDAGPSSHDAIAPDGPPAHSHGMSEGEEYLRIQLSEARTDTKFAQLIGEMRTGFARMDARLSAVERATTGLKATVIGTGVAVIAVVIGVLAYGQTWFGIGVNTRDVIRATITEYVQQMNVPPSHKP